MKKNKIILLLILLFGLTSIPFSSFISAGTASLDKILMKYQPYDIGPELRSSTFPLIESRNFELPPPPETPSRLMTSWSPYYVVGDLNTWLVSDDASPYGVSWAWFNLTYISDTVEVWKQLDLSYPAGDPRNDPSSSYFPVVTHNQLQYIGEEFETNILPKDTAYFGTPDELNGDYGFWPEYYTGSSRDVILVSNVRDFGYYNDWFPYFVIGFYWSLLEMYFDRNIISIDSHQWALRVGPDAALPNQYESTVAHEYQHLIHDDFLTGDDAWMNEACSLYAEKVCGYGIDTGQIEYFLNTPDNSLTEWGDQGDINILADYGSSYLWALYLTDHYGENFMGDYVKSGIYGIDGINALLPGKINFERVYHDWRIANLIDSGSPGHGKYEYYSLDLHDLDTEIRIYDIASDGDGNIPLTTGESFGTTIVYSNGDTYDTGISLLGPYGSDYIRLNDVDNLNLLYFDGADESEYEYGWVLTEFGWYSGWGDLINVLLAGEAYVDPLNPTLEILTYVDIEDYWDFGFVQVSTDGGDTWESLENAYTTYIVDPHGYWKIIENLPGLTGWSGNFIPMTFDLSSYAGQNIQIGFRYMTDWGFNYEGWYIAETDVSGMPINLKNIPYEADFMVTLVEKMTHGDKVTYKVRDMWLKCDENEIGLKLYNINKWEEAILIISPLMEYGWADYSFSSKHISGFGFKTRNK
ncbi:MAG: hypothetical protein ACXACO_15775 [Promethearchaeota archaeon]|jgi:hypothetical protein